MRKIDSLEVQQIMLPNPADTDPHPQLMFKGQEIHAGECFVAWLPDGWQEICLETRWEIVGPGTWYIADPELADICPIGLWCRV